MIYRTIILPVVLYGCETWSLILSEERGLRVFKNRLLRRIFGPKRDEVTREWRKLHVEELNDMYCSPNIIRKCIKCCKYFFLYIYFLLTVHLNTFILILTTLMH